MEIGERFTVTKRCFAYGPNSVACVIPAQLEIAPGEKVKITIEKISQDS